MYPLLFLALGGALLMAQVEAPPPAPLPEAPVRGPLIETPPQLPSADADPAAVFPDADEDTADDSLAGLPPAVVTPPPPRPDGPEAVLLPHLAELQQKLRDHPGQQRADQRVCEAAWSILLGRADYYPQLDASLSSGNKWIDQTTRADEFGGSNSPEYDGRGLNATLTLRQHIFDWGRNSAVIKGYQQDRSVAEIERVTTLDEQLGTLARMALQHVLQSRLVAHFADSRAVIDRDVASMEERFKAGAARLAEMRQARLVGLEAEARLTQAQRQRALVEEAMKTQFGIAPAQAASLIESFITLRPDVPDLVAGEASPRARLIRHNIDKAKADSRRLRAERLPRFSGVVTARGWDVDSRRRCNDLVERGHPDQGRFVENRDGTLLYQRDGNCSTYELTGALEFSMPLFDGGANEAQRGGVWARRRGLEAELAAHVRSHDAESRRLQDQLLDELTQLAEARLRLDELETQIASERLLSTRTRANLLTVLGLEQRLADETARLISLTLRAEGTRIEALQLAGRLAATLNITAGESGC